MRRRLRKNKRGKPKRERNFKFSLPSHLFKNISFSEEIKNLLFGTFLFFLGFVSLLSFFNLAGKTGELIFNFFHFLIGSTIFFLPLIFFLSGIYIISFKRGNVSNIFLASGLFIIGVSGVLELSFNPGSGGILGEIIYAKVLFPLFGFWVSSGLSFVFIILSGLILKKLFISSKEKKLTLEKNETKKEKSILEKIAKSVPSPKLKLKKIELPTKIPRSSIRPPVSPSQTAPSQPPELKLKPVVKIKKYFFSPPPLSLLENEKETPTSGNIRENSFIIKKTLQNFGIPVEMGEVNIGPTVTQYTLKPAEGIKLSKITVLSNDLALALASHPIRIVAPIPGRSLVGIEVPNRVRARVRLRELIAHPNFQNSWFPLPIVLGRDVSGTPVYSNLAKMPHLLVGGATGTGKTLFLNCILLSLLYRPPTPLYPYGSSPEILRLILVDPKRVEFPIYNEIPHLLCPVICDPQKTINVLKWLISEMERRFNLLSQARARDISTYNQKMIRKREEILPYIVLIIDELADLMAAKGREIEAGIVRLAQMARAVGIHLVIATQRPSVEVITGLIKANITARVAFQVASQVDSRTILDISGAEKLIGRGDFLFLSAESAKPQRIQAPYILEKEIKGVVEYLASNYKKEEKELYRIPEEILKEGPKESEALSLSDLEEGEDPLYEEAKRIVIEAKKASASLLQRKLRIGYARAARLLDMLEERRVIGPPDGAKPREVLINNIDNIEREDEKEWEKV